ncbi:hypothetical protein [Nocardioides maradonensis]
MRTITRFIAATAIALTASLGVSVATAPEMGIAHANVGPRCC